MILLFDPNMMDAQNDSFFQVNEQSRYKIKIKIRQVNGDDTKEGAE
jgi:hypothetical protein